MYNNVYDFKQIKNGAELIISINYKEARLIECIKEGQDINEKMKSTGLKEQTIYNNESYLRVKLGVKKNTTIARDFATIDLKKFL